MRGQSIDIIVPERLRGAHTAGMARLATGGMPRLAGRTVEVPAVRRGGEEFPVEVSLHHWRQGGSPYYGAILRDVTERHRVEAHIRHLARHDGLTDLPNREVFHDRLRKAVAASQAGDPGFALVLVDLDRFKDVNDTYGHNAGDALLRQAAERLRAASPDERCTAARVVATRSRCC
jgi:PleD family two-component response regulator